ncbi:MAG: hypothetical protein WDZ73_00815 [Candidatus Paceibacterota bacterium]
MLDTKSIYNLILVQTIFLIGGFILAYPSPISAQTATTSTEVNQNQVCEGYIYSEATNTCSLTTVASCENDIIFSTKEICELENNVVNQRVEDKTGGTILDKARADRKTFIKDRLYDSNSTTRDPNNEDIRVLSDQIIEAQKQILLFEINNNIAKTRNYIPYFENIIYRLEQNLNSSTTSNEESQKLLTEATTKINLASTTISLAEADSNNLLTTDNIGQTIDNLKTQIIETITILKETRTILKQVIDSTKNIL